MVSRIDIGPDGGPYVEIDEDAGDLVIRVPSNTVDFDSNDLLNAVLQNATMDGGSLDGVSLASALDANNQDLNSVGTASVASLEADRATIASTTIDKVDEYVQESSTDSLVTVTFDNLDQNHYRFRLSVSTGVSSGADNALYLDEDDSDGSYNYFTWGGVNETSANKFLISENNNTVAPFAGMIEIKQDAGSERATINSKLGFGRGDSTSDFSLTGGWDDRSFSSVTFEFGDGLRSNSRLEVFEVMH